MTDEPIVPPLTTNMIAAHWDRKVDSYESGLKGGGTDELPQRSEIEIAMWSRLLLRTVGPRGTRVLDVGTGTGALSLLMAQLGYDVTAVDTSPRMLARVEARAQRAGLSLALHEASAAKLPFTNATFDAVVCRLLLWLLLEPEQCVREWARCVRPGGKIVGIDHTHPRATGPVRQLRRLLATRWGGNNDPFAPRMREQFPLWPARDPTPYRNVFVRAGLERVLVEDLTALTLLARDRKTRYARLRWPNTTPMYLIDGVVPASS